MLEILILGRGGQGAQTAGNQLAKALFAKGYHVQTFSTYGGARRGTPVTSSLRADTVPILQRCNITSASALICFDDSLLDEDFLKLGAEDALVVVNSALLGAFVAALQRPDLDTMCAIIDETAPAKKLENVAACREAYGLIAAENQKVPA